MSNTDINPYELMAGDTTASRRRNPVAANTFMVCYLLLLGFPLFTACTLMHSCMCGHLQHSTPAMLSVHVSLDIALGLVFASAAYFAFRSLVRHPKVFVVLLAMIYVDHVLLANGAGYFFILIDAPIMLFITICSLIRWREAQRQLLVA